MSENTSAAGSWTRALRDYMRPKVGRSVFELVITAAPLIALWIAAWVLFHIGLWWVALILTVPAGFFLVRLFMIQHDCGHGSFFPAKQANDWVGRIIGVFTFTPYDYWRVTHAIHHATSGNLDRRGLGAIATLTVAEYEALPPLQRFGYRLYRHPIVLFGVGPAFTFFIQQRVPVGLMKDWRQWVSVLGNTLSVIVFFAALIFFIGAAPVLVINITTMLIAATIGVWLFYIQHQFEDVAWSRTGEGSKEDAALKGSSHYDLPQPLRWMTANIGIHHVHHLSSRIPFYRLSEVLRDHPELRNVSRVGLWESFLAARLSLWDEARQRLVSFREAAKARMARSA